MASDLPRSLGCPSDTRGGTAASCFSAALREQAGREDTGLSCAIPIPWIGTTSVTNRLARRQLWSSPRELGRPAAGAGLPLCRAEHSLAFHLPPSWAAYVGWGSAPRGHVCYVSRKPLQKNILETQRFPFCQHTNEPQTEPTSKCPANEPVSPPSPPRFQEGPNDAAVLQRHQLCFLSLLSGKK